jgi:hypothetical protein
MKLTENGSLFSLIGKMINGNQRLLFQPANVPIYAYSTDRHTGTQADT